MPRHATPAPPSPAADPADEASMPPASPAEQALQAAYEIDSERTIAQAQADVDRATDLAARLSSGLWRESLATELREAFRSQIKATRAWRFLTTIGDHGGPVRIPSEPADVDGPLVNAAVRIQGPRCLVRLLSLCAASATRADSLASVLENRMDRVRESYAGGSIGLGEFLAAMSPTLTDRDALRVDAHRCRNAAAAVLARLRVGAPAAAGDPHDLRTSIRESQVMSRNQDSRLTAMAGELMQVDADLRRLQAEGVPAGRLYAEIESRRENLVDAIASRKSELAAVGLSTGTNLLERAMSGEPAGLAELAAVIAALPKAFEHDLGARIVTLMAVAAVAGADVFAGLL